MPCAGRPPGDLPRLRLSCWQLSWCDLSCHVVGSFWPDARAEELVEALRWYGHQDVTRGG